MGPPCNLESIPMITTLLAPLAVAASFSGVPAPVSGPLQEMEIPKCEGPQILLPSGLSYCVLKDGGDGPHPGMGDRVSVDYTGWLKDGTSFDSSRKPRRPGMPVQSAEFFLGGVIPGWNEILQIMSPGDHFLVTIPSALAYGEAGSPPNIPANSDLTFEMELHKIVHRAPGYLEWNAESEDIITLESGVALRVIEAGEGESVADGALAAMEMTCWTQTGKFAFIHSFIPPDPRRPGFVAGWRQLRKEAAPLPFMRDLAPYARKGARLQVLVPAKLGIDAKYSLDELPDGGNEVWMMNFPVVGKFPKPEFRMPAEEELTTTESGLKYLIVREGTGRRPVATDTVVAHYNGWLTDGNQFDSSFDRGAGSAFPLNRVVPGWTEGIPLIKGGGAIILVIPSELAYGERGQSGIPGGSTLVFYVELLAVH